MGKRADLGRLGIVLCGISAALRADPSWGAEWSFEPSAGLQAVYNTNIQLTSEPHPTVWGLKLSTDVPFRVATEALTVTGGLNVSLDRYFGQPQFNIDNYDLSLRSSYKAERDTYRLDIDAIRSATTANELTTTGVVLAYRPQNTLSVTPSWSHALTEATFIDASYTFSDASYHDTNGTSLTSNLDQQVSLGMHSNIDEGKVYNLVAYYERYETRPSQVLQNNYGVRGGYDHSISETLHAGFLAGWRWTQTAISSQATICDGPVILGTCSGSVVQTTAVQKERNSGFTLNAFLEKRFETDTLRGELSQEVFPSGAGSLVQTQRAAIHWTKQWSPTLTSNVDASAYQSKYIGGVVTGSNSRYYSLNSSLSWQLSEAYTLDVGYNYSRQKLETTSIAANGNMVYVGLRYAWSKLSYSR